MLWIRAFHVISMVTWFAAIFYLPRLMVYHADSQDAISNARFKIMEWRLYYAIGVPSAILCTMFGLWLLISGWQVYKQFGYIHAKMALVVLLWLYFIYCGVLVQRFQRDANTFSSFFYRVFNEVPTIIFVATIILVIVKPF